MKKLIIVAAIFIVAVVGEILVMQKPKFPRPAQVVNQPVKSVPPDAVLVATKGATEISNNPIYSMPISGALSRVTKKPFGLYVTPKNSPVSPEHFTGYHTGVDFETSPTEQNVDVPVYVICSGPLIMKKIATGYGGVAVQSCEINKELVTIIYGHLRLSSVTTPEKTMLSQGQQIGVLGKGYSTETAGERKHLHLGIHKGAAVDLLGYVQDKNQLNQWIDFLTLVK